MMRFVYIGDQIMDDETDFAFFDTVYGRFVTVAGDQVWSTWGKFLESATIFPEVDVPRLKRLVPLALYGVLGIPRKDWEGPPVLSVLREVTQMTQRVHINDIIVASNVCRPAGSPCATDIPQATRAPGDFIIIDDPWPSVTQEDIYVGMPELSALELKQTYVREALHRLPPAREGHALQYWPGPMAAENINLTRRWLACPDPYLQRWAAKAAAESRSENPCNSKEAAMVLQAANWTAKAAAEMAGCVEERRSLQKLRTSQTNFYNRHVKRSLDHLRKDR